MLYDIIEVKIIRDYTLYIKFENNVSGSVDISKIVPFKGIFAKLEDKDFFSTVYVDKELGTIVWENGADLSPSFLYSIISSQVA